MIWQFLFCPLLNFDILLYSISINISKWRLTYFFLSSSQLSQLKSSPLTLDVKICQVMDSPATNAQTDSIKIVMEYASLSAPRAETTIQQQDIVLAATKDFFCLKLFVSRTQNLKIQTVLPLWMEFVRNVQKDSMFLMEFVKWLTLYAKISILSFWNAQIVIQVISSTIQKNVKLHLPQSPCRDALN